MVQHGAVSKDFIYGGYREQKWRNYELQWLFTQELPLFVCTTHREAVRFRLYSTSAMWLLHYQFGDSIAQVELCPDAHHDPLRESRCSEMVGPVEARTGVAYRIPLGNPVVDLTINDLESDSRNRAIETIRIAVDVEQTNLTFRRLGVHVASWFTSVSPNDPDSLKVCGGSIFWNSTQGKNITSQLDALKNIALTLAMNFSAQNANTQLEHLAPVFRLFTKADIPDWILPELPKIVLNNLQDQQPVALAPGLQGAVGITVSQIGKAQR